MEEQNKQPAKGSFAALMQQPSAPPQAKKEDKPAEKVEEIKHKEESPKLKKVEKKERQLNAWITTTQNNKLDRRYFQLRAKGVKIKKGELIGIGIDVLDGILEQFNPKKIDSTLLEEFLAIYVEKKKNK